MNDKITKGLILLCTGLIDSLTNNAPASETKDAPAPDTTPAPEAPRRGRPPKAAPPAAPAEDSPSDEDRYQANRALIEPLVKGGQGEDVKKVITKYSKEGLKGLPADKQADFEKDIEALSY